MAIEVTEFQFSSIWTETILSPLEDPAPADAPLKELGRADTYKALWEQILALQPYRTGMKSLPLGRLFGASQPLTLLSPPWPQKDGQHFWQKYLVTPTLENVKGSQAWNGLVPYRANLPCWIEAASWAAGSSVTLSFFLESLFYPHGVAFVVSVKGRAEATPLSLEDLVDVAFSIKKKKFKTQWRGKEGLFSAATWENDGDELSLDHLAVRALMANKIAALGPAALKHESSALDPFTILTVVVANVPKPGEPIGKDVNRTLDRITGWGTNPFATLPPLDTMKVEVKSSGPGRVLYCRPRGRAVWFPDLSTNSEQQHLLRCYHRNLTLASLQVESLCGVTSATASMIKGHHEIPGPLKVCAIKAAGSLGRLYGNKTFKKSYRSLSPARQMEQNDYVADVNLLRKTFAVGSGKPVGVADPDEIEL